MRRFYFTVARALLGGIGCLMAAQGIAQESGRPESNCTEPYIRADWRYLLQERIAEDKRTGGLPLPASCKNGIVPKTGLPRSALLDCAQDVLDDEWEKHHERPILVIEQRLMPGNAAPVSREFGKRPRGLWVLRQSPHRDQMIRVCPRATVWLEVAPRPRLTTPDIRKLEETPSPSTQEAWVDTPRLSMTNPSTPGEPPTGQLDYKVATPEIQFIVVGGGRVFRKKDGNWPILTQWPSADQWLEPWQKIIVTLEGDGSVFTGTPENLHVSTTKSRIATTGSESTTIRIDLFDESGRRIRNAEIELSASNNGALSPTKLTTRANDSVMAQLSAGNNSTPRTIVVTARTARAGGRSYSSSVSVDVVAPEDEEPGGDDSPIAPAIAGGAIGALLLRRVLRRNGDNQPTTAVVPPPSPPKARGPISVRLRLSGR